MGNPASNTPECFEEVRGQKMLGVIFGPLRHGGYENVSLVFEDGRALCFSSNGAYWLRRKAEVLRSIEKRRKELQVTTQRLQELVELSGVFPSIAEDDPFEEEKSD